MKKWMIRIFAGLIVVLFLYFVFAPGKKENPPKQIAVKKGDIVEKALAVGTIEPEKEIKVKSTIPGIVAEVFFKVGDEVQTGQSLFKISPNPTPLEYVEARRNIEVAEVTRSKLKKDLDRKLQLFKSELIPQSELEDVQSAYNEANLKHKMAMERLELIQKGRIRLANKDIDSIIHAPIGGVILSKSVNQGDPIVPLTNFQPGTEMCSLADMEKIHFMGTVDEIDVGKIMTGMTADIQIGALPDKKILGEVMRIYPKAKKEGNATLFDIEILIKEAQTHQLRAGYSATASIKIRERKQVLLLPERLVIFENGKKYVEIPVGEKIEKREVETGLSDGLNMEIVSGLKEGDKVIERPPREIT